MTTQIRASHILVSNEDDANKILKRIKDGEDFAAVAKRFSSCPSRKNGGDLGWFGKGQMVPEFEQAAFAADQGAVIGPVKTQFGFHVIKVTGKKQPGSCGQDYTKFQLSFSGTRVSGGDNVNSLV